MAAPGRNAAPGQKMSTTTSGKEDHMPPTSLIGPHEAIVAELAPKFNVLAASVISSTQIRKRVTYAVNHLLEPTEGDSGLPRIALLYAKTADVCKLITVVEQCKRVLSEEGKSWYQYNQLFDMPEPAKKLDIVEETRMADDEDSDSGEFEVMQSRFERAVLPPLPSNTVKSMRILISIASVPELRAKPDVTVQSNQDRP